MALSYPEPKVRWAAAVSFHLKLIVRAFKWWPNPREWASRAAAFWGEVQGYHECLCILTRWVSPRGGRYGAEEKLTLSREKWMWSVVY